MREELQRDIPVAEVEDRVAFHFREVFDCEVTLGPEPRRTVSVVVTREDGKVLLLQRTAARGGFWQPVTGHVEEGESPIQAAQRELREETGLSSVVAPLDYEHVFALRDARPPDLVRETAFVARARSGELSPSPRGGEGRGEGLQEEEHDQLGWFTAEEAIAKVPHAGLVKAIKLASS
jgi:lipoyl(octanoyl) transferase